MFFDFMWEVIPILKKMNTFTIETEYPATLTDEEGTPYKGYVIQFWNSEERLVYGFVEEEGKFVDFRKITQGEDEMMEREVEIQEFFSFIRENCADEEIFGNFVREAYPFIERWKINLTIHSGPTTIICEGESYPGYSVTFYDTVENMDSVTFVFLEEDRKFVEFQLMEEAIKPTLH
jgi:hypothetical protein